MAETRSEHTITVGFGDQLEPLKVTIPDGEPIPWDARSKLTVVGARVPRLDARAKVTGQARYTWDIRRPGMLFARILRSPHPSARLVRIDLTAAQAMDGVLAVWSERAGKRILYQGQEVAAVAATSPALAEDALRRIRVDYEPRPFVVDATRARRPDAPQVFEVTPGRGEKNEAEDLDVPGAKVKHDRNVRRTITQSRDDLDIDKAFAAAEVIVEGTYRTQVQTHSALETHGSVAEWEGDQLTLWTSTQATFGVRDQIAAALKIPKDKVRVVCEHMGGGFGAKFGAGHWSVIAAKMAKESGRPVQVMLSRHAEHLVAGNRPDSVQWIKLGAKRDGTLVALHLKAYGTPGVGTGAGVGGPARAIYQLQGWRIEEEDVFTHGGPAQPFRAPGHPQGCFALEQAIDELAEKIGLDPVALRRKNLRNPVQVAELDAALQHNSAWKGRGGRLAPPPGRPRVRRGVGIACGVWYKIYSASTQVEIVVHGDGRVEVRNGAQDLGTGTRTLMAQVAAEELGLPLAQITVKLGDTSWPVGPGSGGSSTAPSIVPTVRAAAYQAKGKLIALAAEALKVKPAQVECKDGVFRVTGKTTGKAARSLPWARVAARIPGDKLSVIASRAKDYQGTRDTVGGVQIAEVEVDLDTGVVRVVKVTVVQDFGRPINRLTADSQINGAVIQGVSYALLEDRTIDRHLGRMVNPNLEHYKIATINDCPEIEIVPFDTFVGFNNAGVIGLGEPPTVPTAAAIANAVRDAIGARVRELPITPDKVLAAIASTRATTPRDARDAKEPR